MIMKLFTATLQNLQVRLGLQGGLSASCPTTEELDHVRPSRQVAPPTTMKTKELDHVRPSRQVAPQTATQELDHVRPSRQVAPQMSPTRKTR